MKQGRVVAAGRPTDVLTEELIANVYDVRARVSTDETSGRLFVRFEPGPVTDLRVDSVCASGVQ